MNEFIGKLTDFLKNEAKTETVIGSPFQLGDFTCVPVIALGLGLGVGGGTGVDAKQQSGTGAGAGAGVGIGPLGFLAVNKDQIQFIPVHQSKGLGAIFEKMPDLLSKYFEKDKAKAEASSV